MRVRTNIILPDDLLAKIDVIAGERLKRAAVIETALREYVAREEKKTINVFNTKTDKSKFNVRAK